MDGWMDGWMDGSRKAPRLKMPQRFDFSCYKELKPVAKGLKIRKLMDNIMDKTLASC